MWFACLLCHHGMWCRWVFWNMCGGEERKVFWTRKMSSLLLIKIWPSFVTSLYDLWQVYFWDFWASQKSLCFRCSCFNYLFDNIKFNHYIVHFPCCTPAQIQISSYKSCFPLNYIFWFVRSVGSESNELSFTINKNLICSFSSCKISRRFPNTNWIRILAIWKANLYLSAYLILKAADGIREL